MWLALIIVCASPSAVGEAVTVDQNVAYVPGGHVRQTLDVYTNTAARPAAASAVAADAEPAPVVVFVHGGGWSRGQKSSARGCAEAILATHKAVVVSVEYRLVPEVTWKDQAGDVAAALKWIHHSVHKYGGDPARITLVGHSAGAHLAALVATDPSYLAKSGLKPDFLHAVVLLDGAAYDVPSQVEAAQSRPRAATIYRTAFGSDLAQQRAASPIRHVGEGPMPPFLIAHVASRATSTAQAKSLASAINASGGRAERLAVRGTHASIYRQFASPSDKVLPEADRLLRLFGPAVTTASGAAATPQE